VRSRPWRCSTSQDARAYISRVKLFHGCARFNSSIFLAGGKYVRYRPAYPSAVLDLLTSDCGLTAASVIADIASGTGIFTRMLLEHGNRCSAWSQMLRCATPARNFCAPILISPASRGRRKPRGLPITASTSSPRPRRPTGLIAKGTTRTYSHLPARRLDSLAVERATHWIDAVSSRL